MPGSGSCLGLFVALTLTFAFPQVLLQPTARFAQRHQKSDGECEQTAPEQRPHERRLAWAVSATPAWLRFDHLRPSMRSSPTPAAAIWSVLWTLDCQHASAERQSATARGRTGDTRKASERPLVHDCIRVTVDQLCQILAHSRGTNEVLVFVERAGASEPRVCTLVDIVDVATEDAVVLHVEAGPHPEFT